MTEKSRLILLPGHLCDRALWAAQISGLGDVADIGIGDLTIDDTIEAMAARVLLGAPSRFALGGLSLGGYVAFEVIRRAPERVTHLALISTSARADRPDQAKRRHGLVEHARIGTFKGVTPRLLPAIITLEHAADPAMAALVLEMTERVGRVAFERQQAAIIGRRDSRPLLSSILCPTLVIGGREDKVISVEHQEEIATGISGARLEILEACGHLAPIEQPDQVNGLFRNWLSDSGR